MEDLGRPDGIKVSGRGELHLGILIEEIRREGSEICVSRPEVIVQHDENGKTLEPMEELIIDVPEEYQGVVIQKLAQRKGELKNMKTAARCVLRLEFKIRRAASIGYRGEFLTDTRGLGILASRFVGYGEWVGRDKRALARLARQHGHRHRDELRSWKIYRSAARSSSSRATRYTTAGRRRGLARQGHPCNPCKRKQQTNHRFRRLRT